MDRFVAALQDEIADLEARLLEDPTYIKLREAKRLLDLYVNSGRAIYRTASAFTPPAMTARPGIISGKSLSVVQAVKVYLIGKSDPVSTRDVMAHLASVGITFGGSAPQNTLSSILSKSPDFISNGRAGWTLAENKLADDGVPNPGTSSADVQPQSGPVEPGQEVAHDNTLGDILG